MIHIDWKFVGRDYLGFFPQEYPDLAFLRGADFAALCDALANELPDTVFVALSGFLAAHGYELWNGDTGGDEYYLAIVHPEATDSFRREFVDEDGDAILDCRRLEPDAPIWVAAAKARKKPPLPEIIAESDYHLEYGGMWRDGVRFSVLRYTADDGDEYHGLIDQHVFPFPLIDAEGFLKLQGGKDILWPVHATSRGQFWQLQKAQKRRQSYEDVPVSLIFVTEYEAPTFTEVPGGPRTNGTVLTVAGHGDALIVLEVNKGMGDEALPWIGPTRRDATQHLVMSIADEHRIRPLARLEGSPIIMSLSLSEVALFSDYMDREERRKFYTVFNVDTGLPSVEGGLPADVEIENYPLRLSEDEVAFIRRTIAPHPTHQHLTEATGWLLRFNLRNRHCSEAKLDGLYNDFTTNMAMLRNQPPDRHRSRSFEGFIRFSGGKDGWSVLNYMTSFSGKHDVAWFWNSDTDEIVKVQGSDFSRRAPSIHYVEALDRYIADDSCQTDLLIPLADIIATRPHARLVFSDPVEALDDHPFLCGSSSTDAKS